MKCTKEMKMSIYEYAHSIGIDCIGSASAEPFYEIEERLKEQYAKGYISGFEEKDIEKRIHPQKTYPEVKTLLSIALAYPSRLHHPKDTEKRGYFARASYGRDYHQILREKMEQLAQYIFEYTGCNAQSFTDTGPLVDVLVAKRAGLGFIGKNGLLITEHYGSYVYLGYIMTELEIPIDSVSQLSCGTCDRCIRACPTEALFGNGSMNAQRCLSYQTQKKGVVFEPYRTKMGKMLYGCDICQVVCPYNRSIDTHLHNDMEPVYEDVAPQLSDILTMNKKEFKERFSYMAGSWRGIHVLQRNALIVARNTKAYDCIPYIKKLLLKTKRAELRVTALESLYILGEPLNNEWKEEIYMESKNNEDCDVRRAYVDLWYILNKEER